MLGERRACQDQLDLVVVQATPGLLELLVQLDLKVVNITHPQVPLAQILAWV